MILYYRVAADPTKAIERVYRAGDEVGDIVVEYDDIGRYRPYIIIRVDEMEREAANYRRMTTMYPMRYEYDAHQH